MTGDGRNPKDDSPIDREQADARLSAIYLELRALVQPSGTLNDAPLRRREELEREAADIRDRWRIDDPRGPEPVGSGRTGLLVLVATVAVLLIVVGVAYAIGT